jgi:hypothetical protein
VPEKAKNDKSEREEISRLAKLEKDDIEPEFPPFDGPQHLLNMFWEVGPTMSGSMGSGPLTHGEIESYQRNICIKLSPWICRTFKRLSAEYLNESHKATKRDCPAPWNPVPEFEIESKKRALVAENLRAEMRRMAFPKIDKDD